MMKKISKPKIEFLALFLVLLSSVLLGIWAVKGTIALRNVLLVLGALISIYYINVEFRFGKLIAEISILKLLPLILITFSFFWVLVHYFIFSVDPIVQLNELKSTWLRAFLASIVGLGTGLALRKHLNRLKLLWLGIFTAFLVLYYQYIPRALAQNKLLVPDYDHYLFHLKADTVLIGTILIVGSISSLHLKLITIQYLRVWDLTYSFISIFLALWAYVYIVDARNGIGLAIIIFSFWFVYIILIFIRRQQQISNKKKFFLLLFSGIGLILAITFLKLQISTNKGWNNFFEDVKISVQIEKYPHWQNTEQMRYPKRKDGHEVVNNTYQRVSLAVAGAIATIQYPQGVGILDLPFTIHPNSPNWNYLIETPKAISSHSGWVELGLSFGIPILVLIFLTLLIFLYQALFIPRFARLTIMIFTIAILFLYTVSEITVKHGIEILYYLLSMITGLLFVKSCQNFSQNNINIPLNGNLR